MPNQEHDHTSHMEHSPEIVRDAHERSQELGEQLRNNPERFNKKEAHQAVETARSVALQEALLSKEQGKERRSHQADRHNATRRHIVTRDDREASFEQTMKEVRKHTPRATRPFSRFIHGQAVERISETLGKTIARPHAILAGGITAFVAVLGLYFYAKYAGFALRGSETIIAFAIGWLLGILFDFFKAMFTGKR